MTETKTIYKRGKLVTGKKLQTLLSKRKKRRDAREAKWKKIISELDGKIASNKPDPDKKTPEQVIQYNALLAERNLYEAKLTGEGY